MDKGLFLEAVYYSAPVPRSREAITLMGLVFDRVHFPGVHLPNDGFTEDTIAERIEGLEKVLHDESQSGRTVEEAGTIIRALHCLRWKRWTEGFLVYTNVEGNIFESPDGAPELVNQIYEMTFGPSAPGFKPMFDTGSVFAIARNQASIVYPGSFYYPAGALLFAAKHGLPLINDLPELAVPGLPDADLDAKALATVLAVQCVQILLPSIPQIDVYDLLDFRDEMRPHVEPFRLALLKLTMQLNLLIQEGATQETIQKKLDLWSTLRSPHS